MEKNPVADKKKILKSKVGVNVVVPEDVIVKNDNLENESKPVSTTEPEGETSSATKTGPESDVSDKKAKPNNEPNLSKVTVTGTNRTSLKDQEKPAIQIDINERNRSEIQKGAGPDIDNASGTSSEMKTPREEEVDPQFTESEND